MISDSRKTFVASGLNSVSENIADRTEVGLFGVSQADHDHVVNRIDGFAGDRLQLPA